jgi:hypothetical protein
VENISFATSPVTPVKNSNIDDPTSTKSRRLYNDDSRRIVNFHRGAVGHGTNSGHPVAVLEQVTNTKIVITATNNTGSSDAAMLRNIGVTCGESTRSFGGGAGGSGRPDVAGETFVNTLNLHA